MSLPVLLSEVKRHWYARFYLSIEAFFQGKSSMKNDIGVLEDPKHGSVARQFLTPDRKRALFLLRMDETARSAPREEIIHRHEGTVRREGFRTLLVVGEYSLLSQMGQLISSSILTGSSC